MASRAFTEADVDRATDAVAAAGIADRRLVMQEVSLSAYHRCVGCANFPFVAGSLTHTEAAEVIAHATHMLFCSSRKLAETLLLARRTSRQLEVDQLERERGRAVIQDAALQLETRASCPKPDSFPLLDVAHPAAAPLPTPPLPDFSGQPWVVFAAAISGSGNGAAVDGLGTKHLSCS